MTATQLAAATYPAAGFLGEARLLSGVDTGERVGLTRHRALHGEPVRLRLAELVELCERVNLTGRGGATFPVARKLRSLGSGRPVVVVSGTESEPASYKDRLLLGQFPHLVLDGAIVVADAIGARTVHLAVHTDPVLQADLATVLAERADRRRFWLAPISGGFVAGEARSVIRALNGGPALPPGRRMLPTAQGVHGKPTLLSNAETFAQLALLASRGPDWFRAIGTRDEPGSTLLTVGGAVRQPGVLEVPLGIPLADVLSACGANPPAALVVGGYHGGWLPPDRAIRLSNKALAGAGGRLGAGVLLVLDDATCALGELARVTGWLAAQSAGQCGPCAFGLPALARDVAGLTMGARNLDHVVQRHLQLLPGRGACAHPDGAAGFVGSALRVLGAELNAHRRHGSCGRPVLGQLPIGGQP